ncbi:MAG: hypothetical protein JW833_00155, partial [Prolixibacteraceae bacterium]|nr:hypothetical protein [Prolixibacteraceae bacterium]
KPTDKKIIFIACAFGNSEIDQLSNNCFIPTITQNNFEFFRVDFSEPSYSITESIIEHINISSVLLADLTFARQSVYFEIGFALGLGIPTILTCRKDHFRNNVDNLKVHFDLEQFKISFWETINDNFIWGKNMSPENRLINLKI